MHALIQSALARSGARRCSAFNACNIHTCIDCMPDDPVLAPLLACSVVRSPLLLAQQSPAAARCSPAPVMDVFGVKISAPPRSSAMALSCALVVGAMLSRSGTQQPHLRRSTTLAQHLQSLLLLLFFIHACIDSCRHSFTDHWTHSLNYSLIHSFASHSHQLFDCLIGCLTDCLMPRLCIFFVVV